MKILVASGKQGAGKTYLVKQVALFGPDALRVKVIKFADPLYQLQDLIYDHVGIERPLTKDRKLLQWLGTEWGREKDANIWVNLWANKVRQATKEGYDLVITDDMRFPNEYEAAIRMEACLVRIDSPREVRAQRINLVNENHPSEIALDKGYEFEYTIYSSSDQETNDAQVKEMLEDIFNEKR